MQKRASFAVVGISGNIHKMPRLEHEHTKAAIADRISSVRHNYVRDWIYGGVDGAVTTFAVVSGVAGAELSTKIVLILGFANLVADGFSMAASNYLGTRAEQDDYRRLEAIEYRHIKHEPEGEREEIRQIYREKGFEGEELEKAVELITADDDRWVKTMLVEEYGLPAEIRSAWMAASATFSAFIICGLVPLLPYLFGAGSSFLVSCIMTGITFFLIGSFKSRWSTQTWLRSGMETLFVGALAAVLAYGVGVLLKGIAG
jgi:VIT1/CCC1 family predicted Fe2+/Mn2+ transporter